MALFGTPDPAPIGQPVLGPLAASVAGFTQGLGQGLQSRADQKAALAKQRAQEKVARTRAAASTSRRLATDFKDLTKVDSDRVREIGRQSTALKKQLGDPLGNLTDEQKTKLQFDINLLEDEETNLRNALSSFSRLEVVVGSLNPTQQATFKQNLLRTTEFRDFNNHEDFQKFKKEFTAPFDPRVGKPLGEALEAELERGTIRLRDDILGPGEIVFDEEDNIDAFLEGLF